MADKTDRSILGKLAGERLTFGQKSIKGDPEAEYDGALCAFSLFSDSIERFDTLLMEIRHLQTNLIYFMRAPELHAALRYEESYIFGSYTDKKGKQADWSTLFGQGKDDSTVSLDDLPRLAEAFVPTLPVSHDEYGFDMLTSDLMERTGDRAFPDLYDRIDLRDYWRQVVVPITRALRRRWMTGQEDDSYQTSYQVFTALQGIKRNIIHDKLYLAWYGARAFFIHTLGPAVLSTKGLPRRQSTGAERRSDFMIVRAVAEFNIKSHINALADFHTHFEKTIDVGLQENHRPITGRRREQGMYHFMLGERARDLYIEASRVIERLSGNESAGNLYRGLPVFVHRWSHDATSRNRAVPSFTRTKRVEEYETPRESNDNEGFTQVAQSYTAFTVNTSFFMPDRPDLQPTIAHEAVHCVLLELFDQMAKPSDRLSKAGVFTHFWEALVQAGRESDRIRQPNADEPDDHTLALIREITVDTIAASLSGPGYLFALFQELCGSGLDELVRIRNDRDWGDMSLLADTLKARGLYTKINKDSYIRLTFACDVTEQLLMDSEDTPHVQSMINGIRQCINDLFARVAIIHSEDPAQQDDKGATRFTNQVQTVTTFFRDAARQSGIWPALKKIREDNFVESDGMLRKREEQPTRYPVFAEDTRARLIEFYIERKLSNYKRPLQKALLNTAAPITSQNFPLKRINDFREPAKILSNARNNTSDAAKAVAMFAKLYLHGEGAKKKHDALDHECEKIKDLVAKGKDKDARTLLDEILLRLPCFTRLSDIAWQSSYFRSMEMAAQLGNNSENQAPLTTLSQDFAPGRETLQLAIEFWGFERRMTINGLGEATRLQMNLMQLPTTGEAINWRPGATYGTKGRNIIDSMVKRVLPGDLSEMQANLATLSTEWASAGCNKLAQQASNFSQLTTVEDIRSHTGSMAYNALRDWLGSELDADFLEVQAIAAFQESAEAYAEKGNRKFKRRVEAFHISLLKDSFQKGASRTDEHKAAKTKHANLTTLIAALDDLLASHSSTMEETVEGNVKSLYDLACTQRDAVLNPQDQTAYIDAVNRAVHNVSKAIATTPNITVFANFSVAVPSAHHIDPERSSVRRLSQSEETRQLIDDCTQSIRVFELSHICAQLRAIERLPEFHNGRVTKIEEAAAQLGALQILKLDASYPHLVFPMQSQQKVPWDIWRLKSLQNDIPTPLGPKDCCLLQTFIMRAQKNLSPSKALALICVAAADIMERRLKAILEVFPDAFKAGVAHFEDEQKSDLGQIKARPITLRLNGDIGFSQKVNMLSHAKLRTLARAYSAPSLAIQDLSPLQALLERLTPDANLMDNSAAGQVVMRDMLKALSKPSKGLRAFKTVYVSRQSLIDTHWWREIDSPTLPASGSAIDPKNWAAERQNASFYHHAPQKTFDATSLDVPPVSGVRRLATLGRYDFFSFSNNVVFGQQRLPLMDRSLGHDREEIFTNPDDPYSKLKHERVYRSFFTRGEFALALALKNDPIEITAPALIHHKKDQATGQSIPKKKDVIAILSLRLDRRSSRLAFAHRLRKATSDWIDYRNAAKKQGGSIDDVFGDASALEQDLAGKNNRFAHAPFRRSVFQSLMGGIECRHHDLQANGIDLNKLQLRDKAAQMADISRKFDEFRNQNCDCDAEKPEQPTRLGQVFDVARHFAELPSLTLEGAGPFIQPGDVAFLGEGWGDLYIVLCCDQKPERQNGQNDTEYRRLSDVWLQQGVRRLYDVFSLQHALFQDHSVYRTETFLRPITIPFAAVDKSRMQLSMSVRSREDRELDGMVQRMLRSARKNLCDHLPRLPNSSGKLENDAQSDAESDADYHARLSRMATIAHVPGRNDFEFTITDFDDIRTPSDPETRLRDRSPTSALELIHEIAGAGEGSGGGGTEEILTRISFRHSISSQSSDCVKNQTKAKNASVAV